MEFLKSFLNKNNLKKYSGYTNTINKLAIQYNETVKPEDIAQELINLRENSKLSSFDKTVRAMALAKNAASHVLGMTYYDVQIKGALALADGEIAEMKTGEGKTLTCSAAVAANFAQGFKTHVVTANEYLAVRDRETLSALYDFMGITNSHNISTMSKDEKREAYQCDVVYSVASELGFDYLKDNLVYDIKEKVQQISFEKTKALIDEADFILIDEARTPMIISNPSTDNIHDKYYQIIDIVNKLQKMPKEPSNSILEMEEKIPGDFWLDEKNKQSHLSDDGFNSLEQLALEAGFIQQKEELYNNSSSWIIREIRNAINAKYLYLRDRDYIVRNQEIVIIDSNTGRLAEGRSWSEGLAQAIQAKEGVEIQAENASSGTISVQNYFRLYSKISGMSGTIMTSSEEFEFIYNSSTIEIPKNRPNRRTDHNDKLFLNQDLKYKAIIEEITNRRNKKQPILVGTVSVKESELISSLLDQAKIPHYVLNAKNHLQEAQIIAQAGIPQAVTVATSMAGRGTDIILGGNQEVFKELIKTQLEELAERRDFLNNQHLKISAYINEQRVLIAQQQEEQRLRNEEQLAQEKLLQEMENKNQELVESANQLKEDLANKSNSAPVNFGQKWGSANYYKPATPKPQPKAPEVPQISTENPNIFLEPGQPTPDIFDAFKNQVSPQDLERYKREVLDMATQIKKANMDGKDVGQNQLQISIQQFNTSLVGDSSTDEFFDYILVNEKLTLLHHPLILGALLHSGPAIFNKQLNVIENSIHKQQELISANMQIWKEEVINAGGLCVIGCSRSESRRIDNQLSGRAGRQGDCGESIFFLSLEDEWIRVFVEGKTLRFLEKTIKNLPYIEGKFLSSSFESTQRKRESQSYEGRKNTFQYDSAADDARKSFIGIRDSILKQPETILEYLRSTMQQQLKPIAHDGFFSHLEDKLKLENTSLSDIQNSVFLMPYDGMVKYANLYLQDEENAYALKLIENNKELSQDILDKIDAKINELIAEIPQEDTQQFSIMCLQSLDQLWSDMLGSLDEMRQNVSFRQVAQKNPLYEFKNLCFEYFQSLISNFQISIIDNFHTYQQMKNQQLLEQASATTEVDEPYGFFDDTAIEISANSMETENQ